MPLLFQDLKHFLRAEQSRMGLRPCTSQGVGFGTFGRGALRDTAPAAANKPSAFTPGSYGVEDDLRIRQERERERREDEGGGGGDGAISSTDRRPSTSQSCSEQPRQASRLGLRASSRASALGGSLSSRPGSVLASARASSRRALYSRPPNARPLSLPFLLLPSTSYRKNKSGDWSPSLSLLRETTLFREATSPSMCACVF